MAVEGPEGLLSAIGASSDMRSWAEGGRVTLLLSKKALLLSKKALFAYLHVPLQCCFFLHGVLSVHADSTCLTLDEKLKRIGYAALCTP
jgi:hypothetical protein